MIKDWGKVHMSCYLREVSSFISFPMSLTSTCLMVVSSCVIHTYCKNTSETVTSIKLL